MIYRHGSGHFRPFWHLGFNVSVLKERKVELTTVLRKLAVLG